MRGSRPGPRWLRGPVEHPDRPTPEQILEELRAGAPEPLPPPPLVLDVAHLFELPDVPRPPRGDARPLLRWRLEVEFACHDVRVVGTAAGVLGWPEEPVGDVLGAMRRLLVAERLAEGGYGPEYLDYTDVDGCRVEQTDAAATHPLAAE
ncbi:MAG: hypothetical protein IT374_03590 [Polyangiaceae bacterium]|nr:hypothetical protein [Polyangiaceae bacterium]